MLGTAPPVADGQWLLLLDDVVGNAPPVANGQWPLLYRPWPPPVAGLLGGVACDHLWAVVGNRERASDAYG